MPKGGRAARSGRPPRCRSGPVARGHGATARATATWICLARVTGSGTVHCSVTTKRDPAMATGSGKVTCLARVTGWGNPTCSGTGKGTVTWTGWATVTSMAMARVTTCSAKDWARAMTCLVMATVPHWTCWGRVMATWLPPRRCWAAPPAGPRQRSHHRPPWRVPRRAAGWICARCEACQRFCACVLRGSSRLLGRSPGRYGSQQCPGPVPRRTRRAPARTVRGPCRGACVVPARRVILLIATC